MSELIDRRSRHTLGAFVGRQFFRLWTHVYLRPRDKRQAPGLHEPASSRVSRFRHASSSTHTVGPFARGWSKREKWQRMPFGEKERRRTCISVPRVASVCTRGRGDGGTSEATGRTKFWHPLTLSLLPLLLLLLFLFSCSSSHASYGLVCPFRIPGALAVLLGGGFAVR